MLSHDLRGAACASAVPEFPAQTSKNGVSDLFSPMRAAYIKRVLTDGELSVVADPADALIIARIKRMSDDKLARFEQLEPISAADVRLYRLLQLCWLRTEEYLLSTQLGRAPTHRELFADFMRNHNGLRFRAYFALKYPGRVRPRRSLLAN